MSYYNTTNQKDPKLSEYKAKAESQKNYILRIIKMASKKDKQFCTSSSLLMNLPSFERTPITSIRRAVSNLVDEGELIYTGKKRKGLYGHEEKVIKLNK